MNAHIVKEKKDWAANAKRLNLSKDLQTKVLKRFDQRIANPDVKEQKLPGDKPNGTSKVKSGRKTKVVRTKS